MKVRYEHLIPAPYQKVVDAYRSTEFYEQKQKNSGAISVEIERAEERPDGSFHMVARVSEPSRMPSFLRKSDVDHYTDDTVLDPQASTLTWKITPDQMAEVFLLSGLIEFADLGEQTRVTFNVELRVKIPLVGKKAEKIGLQQSEKESEKQAAFLKQWVADH